MNKKKLIIIVFIINSYYLKFMRTIIYCRVSNLRDSSFSFISQEEECKKYCQENKLKVKYIYKEHNSGHGKQKVLDNLILTNKEINLIIYDITRFSRSKVYGEKLLKTCKKRNINIHFVRDKIVYTPNDSNEEESIYKIITGLKNSNNEWNSIRDRIITSINIRRKHGMCLGNAPFGFDKIDKMLVPNNNFNAIRLIIHLRNGIKSIHEIRQILNKVGKNPKMLSFFDENNKEITLFSQALTLDFKTITKILNDFLVCDKHWINSNVTMLYNKYCQHEEFKFDTEFVNKFNLPTNIQPITYNNVLYTQSNIMYEDN